MQRLFRTIGGATLLLSALLATAAPAQTTTPASNQNQGAFEKLPPGEQKIAAALYAAELKNPTVTKPLSRDDIAAMKLQGKGWGGVFKEMREQGLVQEKNLGQVVNQGNRDRSDLKRDRSDLKKDREDLREDRKELRDDIRSGASREKVQADRQDLRQDRQDLRNDERDLRGDRQEARQERPERPNRFR